MQEFLFDTLSVNENGHLLFAGADTVELAKKYATPLYVIDLDGVSKMCRFYVDTMKKYFGESSLPLYAGKALCYTNMYKLVSNYGMGADVVSSGELYTALNAGFPVEKIYFHGNNKTAFDIDYAISSHIGCIVCDNVDELKLINDISKRYEIKQKILLRLTPGIDPHTHVKINTGKIDSKFGSSIDTLAADEITSMALKMSNIDLKGFHCHIGSQIWDSKPFTDAAVIMLNFIADMKNKYSYEAEELNLGGGFGARYTKEDPQIDYESNIAAISKVFYDECNKHNINPPKVLLEPGRSIVAQSGITLYSVGSVKTIPEFINYVSIDGGMADNPRYTLYSAQYTIINASHANEPTDFKASIAGRCCESGDMIAEGVNLAKPEAGDIIAVLSTGAYNYSMASNYNRLPRAPIIGLNNKTEHIEVRRESFKDIIALDN